MQNDFAAGASAARHKVASYLGAHGVTVVSSDGAHPPTDDDFLQAVLGMVSAAPASGDSVRDALVVFEWRGLRHYLPVRSLDVAAVASSEDMIHILFEVCDAKWGRSTFFLARNPADVEGRVSVFRVKHWRQDADDWRADRFDTVLLQLAWDRSRTSPTAVSLEAFLPAWVGPEFVEFIRHSDHTRTVRYRAVLDAKTIDAHLPRELLPGHPPRELIVGIATQESVLRALHAGSARWWRGGLVGRYSLREDKGDKLLYMGGSSRHPEHLYLPIRLFEDRAPPGELFLRAYA